MCEIIIKRTSMESADPIKNLRGCYKRGDVVEVMEDGLADTMPHLTVIKIPGLVVKDAEFLMSSLKDASKNVLIRREYYIPENLMKSLFPNDTVTQKTVSLQQWNVWKSSISKKVK